MHRSCGPSGTIGPFAVSLLTAGRLPQSAVSPKYSACWNRLLPLRSNPAPIPSTDRQQPAHQQGCRVRFGDIHERVRDSDLIEAPDRIETALNPEKVDGAEIYIGFARHRIAGLVRTERRIDE